MSTLFIIALLVLSITCQLDGKPLSDSSDSAVKSLSVSGKKGLTFVKEDHLVKFGIDLVGCRNWSDPNGMNCDAYAGDTLCSEPRPVLCVKVDNTPRPGYFVYGNGAAMTAAFYAGWNLGHITTTVPIKGSQFGARADVDAFCATSFG